MNLHQHIDSVRPNSGKPRIPSFNVFFVGEDGQAISSVYNIESDKGKAGLMKLIIWAAYKKVCLHITPINN